MAPKKLKPPSASLLLAKIAASADEGPGDLLTSPNRLRKIDLLRDKNIGKYLPLPQLVAVGDQSSGKSSLLESLTGIPFPRGQELCTRYATQITHRRETETFITVSIIPGPSASERDKQELEKYQRSVLTTTELHQQLPGILEEVNILMGIRTPQNPMGSKTFTEDVLKIEKCGPNEDYLTVIDVPGIFRITTNNVTTESDKTMVRNMVQKYIRNNQTIILAVLPCVVDIATQEILAMAEQYDPTGQRTLGITALEVTCPDKRVREEVLSQISEELVSKYETSLQQVKFLVSVERDSHPYTLNDFFRTKLADLQSKRMEKQLGKNLQKVTYNGQSQTSVIPMADVKLTLRDKDGGKYIAEDLHDLIKSYYEVARDRFIDNVYRQVVTHYLVSGDGEDSPLRLFSEKWVLGLQPDKLEAIGGESYHTREQREGLTKRIQDLTDAVEILR